MCIAKTPSLEDLISHHGLKKKDLRLECPRYVRDSIALRIVEWKIIGRFFSLPREKLAAIERDNDTEEQRRVAVLDGWSEKEGKGATYLKLAEVLHQRERGDLIGLLCDAVKAKPVSNLDTLTRNTEDEVESVVNRDATERSKALEIEFDNLHQRLMSELTEGEACSREELLRAVTMLPVSVRNEYQNLIQQRLRELIGTGTTFELFLRLSPLFAFVDYGLLDHLISRFGSSKLQNDMKSYVSKIQVFMRETTVADLMDYWPGNEESHINYSKLKAKFSDDPKTYTLERLNDFRRKFCSKVRLSDFIFGLITLEAAGSFLATWLVPTTVSSELAKMISEIDESFFWEEHVIMVSLDQNVLYQVTALSDIACASLPETDTMLKEGVVIPDVKVTLDHKVVDISSHDYTSPSARKMTEERSVRDISISLQSEMKRLKTVMNEKDLEIQRLQYIIDEAERVQQPLIQSYAAKISERVCTLVTFIQDEVPTLEGSSGERLEQMKIELQKLTENLGICAEQMGKKIKVKDRETDRLQTGVDNITGESTLEKHEYIQNWLAKYAPNIPPSDSGRVTEATSEVSVTSEPENPDPTIANYEDLYLNVKFVPPI